MVKTKYALIINPDAEVQSQAIDNFFLTAKKNLILQLLHLIFKRKIKKKNLNEIKNGILKLKT